MDLESALHMFFFTQEPVIVLGLHYIICCVICLTQ